MSKNDQIFMLMVGILFNVCGYCLASAPSSPRTLFPNYYGKTPPVPSTLSSPFGYPGSFYDSDEDSDEENSEDSTWAIPEGSVDEQFSWLADRFVEAIEVDIYPPDNGISKEQEVKEWEQFAIDSQIFQSNFETAAQEIDMNLLEKRMNGIKVAYNYRSELKKISQALIKIMSEEDETSSHVENLGELGTFMALWEAYLNKYNAHEYFSIYRDDMDKIAYWIKQLCNGFDIIAPAPLMRKASYLDLNQEPRKKLRNS